MAKPDIEAKQKAWEAIAELVRRAPICQGIQLIVNDGDGDVLARAWGESDSGQRFDFSEGTAREDLGDRDPVVELAGLFKALVERLQAHTGPGELLAIVMKSKGNDPTMTFHAPTDQPLAHRAAVFEEPGTSRDTKRAALLMALPFLLVGMQSSQVEADQCPMPTPEYRRIHRRIEAGIAMVQSIQEVLQIPEPERVDTGMNLVDYGIVLATWAMRR